MQKELEKKSEMDFFVTEKRFLRTSALEQALGIGKVELVLSGQL